jgi:hypothetical protein
MKHTIEDTVALDGVLRVANNHIETWRNLPESKWYLGLMEEMAELGLALVGEHQHLPDHELRQIAAIAINWLDYRNELALGWRRTVGESGGDNV